MTRSIGRKIHFPPLLLPALIIMAGMLFGPVAGRFSVEVHIALAGLVLQGPVCFHRESGTWGLRFVLFTAGFLLMAQTLYPCHPEHHVSRFADKGKHMISGTVESVIEATDLSVRYRLNVTGIQRMTGDPVMASGTIRFSCYGQEDAFQPGSRIRFPGTIRSFRSFRNPGGFNYKRYMTLNGFTASSWARTEDVDLLPGIESGNFLDHVVKQIETFRRTFNEHIASSIDEQGSRAVVSALATGSRRLIPDELNAVFARTGMAHILAISGFHMSVVSALFFFLFKAALSVSTRLVSWGMARRIACVLTLVPLTVFGYVSGFSPSTQRAWVMIVLVLAAVCLGREPDMMNSLSAAAIAILLVDPGALYSISFQLSFSALIGIIAGTRILERLHPDGGSGFRGRLMSYIGIFFSITAVTQPLVMAKFNVVSLAGIFVNPIAMPVFGFLVIPLVIAALLSFLISPGLSSFLLKGSAIILEPSIRLLKEIAELPFSWIRTVTPSSLELVIWYLFLLSLVGIIMTDRKRAGLITIGVCVAAFSILSVVQRNLRWFNTDMSVTVIDVGQGSSALLELPKGRRVLVDGGGFAGTSSFDPGQSVVAPFLWKKKITTLDAVIMTHPEADHMNGLVFIAENFVVNRFITTSDSRDSVVYRNLLHALKLQGILPEVGTELREPLASGEWSFLFLHPKAYGTDPVHHIRNDSSLVFKVVFRNFSILFPGDITSRVEHQLACVQPDTLLSTVLIAPHHGSMTSSSQIFLDQVQPESVIVPCGWKNKFGFPHHTVIDRYRRAGMGIYRTDQSGAVLIRTNGLTFDISTCQGE